MLVKNVLSYIFTTLLFIGCAIFVIIRGQKCFQKFLEKPQKTQISYEFTGNIDFPVITICETKEDAYDENVFEQCQLNISDYKKKWSMVQQWRVILQKSKGFVQQSIIQTQRFRY